MTGGAHRAWLLAVCAAVLGLRAGAGPLPLLGISTNIRQGGSAADLAREMKGMRAAGCTLMYVSFRWSDLEPRPGERDLKPLQNAVRGASALGYRLAITLQTIDTNNRTLPQDLQGKAFDSPEVLGRFGALVREVAAQLNSSVRWVMLGNEVDVYLAEHPGELEPFCRFLAQGRDALRRVFPAAAAGVTCTFEGARSHQPLFRRLSDGSGVTALTYYPLRADFTVRPSSDVAGDVAEMVRLAAGGPLFVQEAGYPADPLLGSSEDRQAAFVDAVFDAVQKQRGAVAGINFFLLYDFGDPLVDTFLKYYRLATPSFRAYLATLGLRRADGTPRKAYQRFIERAGAWAGRP